MSFSSSWKLFVVSCAATIITVAAAVALSYQLMDRKAYKKLKKVKKKDGTINIGAIFGMDVGGTLTKIVYFERDITMSKSEQEHDNNNSYNNSDSNSNTNTIGYVSNHDNGSNSTGLQSPTTGLKQPKLMRMSSSESLSMLEQPDHQEALQHFYNFMDQNKNTTNLVIHDDALSLESTALHGRLHFLHFETRNMVSAIKFVSATAPVENIKTIGCTGGGAHKYASEFEEELEIIFDKHDELSSLVRGMHFAVVNFPEECYTYRACVNSTTPSENNDSNSTLENMKNFTYKDSVDSYTNYSDTNNPDKSSKSSTNNKNDKKDTKDNSKSWRKDVKDRTNKVILSYDSLTTFPYLVVNIGSGVSILKVTSPGEFSRVSGTSLGGGTYWGLCRLLTRCDTYEEVLDLAEAGDAGVVDMLVKDIYGGDYDGIKLSGAMVASSFGKLVMKENPWDGVREEDIALALLMMITNNIGQVAHLNAQLHSCSKIFFVGSFLRHNPISCRRLSFAIDFWSAGKMEAIFLAHEGYFGALGTFLESAFGDEVDRFLLDITIDADEAVKTDNNSNANQDINSEPEDGNHMSLVEKLSPLNAAMSYFDGFKQTVAGRQRSNSATNVTSGNTNENYSLPQLLDYLSVDSQKGSIKNSTNYSNSHFLRARSISDDSAIRSQKKNMNSFIANNENKSSGKSISSLSTSNSEVCNSYEDTNDDTIYEDSK